MLEKIKALIEKHYDLLAYLFFGVLTTAVNYLVYLPCYHIWGIASVSNVVAWLAAVAFAFVTNKPFVFKSHDWSPKVLLPELAKFIGCRLGSGILETLILFVAVDLAALDGNWMKVITAIIVVLVNYFGSKLLVFQK